MKIYYYSPNGPVRYNVCKNSSNRHLICHLNENGCILAMLLQCILTWLRLQRMGAMKAKALETHEGFCIEEIPQHTKVMMTLILVVKLKSYLSPLTA